VLNYQYDGVNRLSSISDTAGQITQVSVQRNGVVQNRNFTWSGSDMTSSTTPEAGTVTYAYDGNHHVLTRTDAKSQQTQYSYDAYERLTQVNHSTYGPNPVCNLNCLPGLLPQPWQQVNYTYDVNLLATTNYSWGRLTAVNFQGGPEGPGFFNFAYQYGYNQAGRVTTDQFLIGDSALNQLTSLQATYVWDTQGRMTNLTYPSGTALAYQYDAMSRLSGITQNGGAIATAGYTAASQLNTLQYGTFYESRTYNNLMQLTQLTNVGVSMQYAYTAGQNNGRVSSTTDYVLGETVNYTYDMWNRLASATATTGTWGEGYAFDGFGNLTGKTPTAGSAPAMSYSADPATNRPMGVSYDANGNPNGAGEVWDVENRLIGTGAGYYPATRTTLTIRGAGGSGKRPPGGGWGW
jgi:YD repeat-containing protein